MEIVVRAPVRGYAPGQFINLDIMVKNKSGTPVSHFEVELIQVCVRSRYVDNFYATVEHHPLKNVSFSFSIEFETIDKRTNKSTKPTPTFIRMNGFVEVNFILMNERKEFIQTQNLNGDERLIKCDLLI